MSFITFIFIAFTKVIKAAERFGLFREIPWAAALRQDWRPLETKPVAGRKKRRDRMAVEATHLGN